MIFLSKALPTPSPLQARCMAVMPRRTRSNSSGLDRTSHNCTTASRKLDRSLGGG
jgi:hypothetical protein